MDIRSVGSYGSATFQMAHGMGTRVLRRSTPKTEAKQWEAHGVEVRNSRPGFWP